MSILKSSHVEKLKEKVQTRSKSFRPKFKLLSFIIPSHDQGEHFDLSHLKLFVLHALEGFSLWHDPIILDRFRCLLKSAPLPQALLCSSRATTRHIPVPPLLVVHRVEIGEC